jgi:protoporphyrinogen oxidase
MNTQERQNRQVVIVGGGPAGLTGAYELSRAGMPSIVLEQDSTVGGISKTVNYKNYLFDIGGHRFFTKVDSVEEMWRRVLGDNFLSCNRLSRIYYNNAYFSYPLRPMNALFGLGIWNSIRIALSYLHSQCFPLKNEDTLEQWVSNRFGKRLYEIFFKTYTEKVWGMPCSEIRAEWAAQRIKGLSLVTAIINALIKNGGRHSNKSSVITTLIDHFNYPKFGPGMLWQMVADTVQASGSQVKLGCEVDGILWSANKVEALEVKQNGRSEVVSGTDFISSMPIREAILKFKPALPEEVLEAAQSLKYRDFLTVALIINQSALFPDNWIYIHNPDVKVGRIQNYKNWSPFMVPDPAKTCLGLEYFCFQGDDLWTSSDNKLIQLAKEELQALGLASPSDVVDGTVVRMPYAYPIYDSTYKASLSLIRNYLSRFDNFQLVGRCGMHKYNNQDHSMLTAMLAAKNILGENHDLWNVNVDQSYHEEIDIERAEKLLGRVFSKIDKLALATSAGIVSGFLLFLATIILTIKGGTIIGPTLGLLGQYFSGYTVSLGGAFVGFAYAFSLGFLSGWTLAYLRNLLIAFYVYRIKRAVGLLRFRDYLSNI